MNASSGYVRVHVRVGVHVRAHKDINVHRKAIVPRFNAKRHESSTGAVSWQWSEFNHLKSYFPEIVASHNNLTRRRHTSERWGNVRHDESGEQERVVGRVAA